jgi:hypothetical protein
VRGTRVNIKVGRPCPWSPCSMLQLSVFCAVFREPIDSVHCSRWTTWQHARRQKRGHLRSAPNTLCRCLLHPGQGSSEEDTSCVSPSLFGRFECVRIGVPSYLRPVEMMLSWSQERSQTGSISRCLAKETILPLPCFEADMPALGIALCWVHTGGSGRHGDNTSCFHLGSRSCNEQQDSNG